MPRLKPEFKIKSYGLYTPWNRQSKLLPKIIKHTTQIPASLDVEFGFVLSVKRAKGEMLQYCIDHPPFRNANGDVEPPFEGEYFVSSNDFEFFLGDTLWEPIEDKCGAWHLSVYHNGKEIVKKSFFVEMDSNNTVE